MNRKDYLINYRKSKIGKENMRKRSCKYQKTDKAKKVRNIYRKTENYKRLHRIDSLICQSKRRDFGSHRISLPLTVPFEWHHVNKNDVVAIQYNIHRVVKHICGDGKLEGVVG